MIGPLVHAAGREVEPHSTVEVPFDHVASRFRELPDRHVLTAGVEHLSTDQCVRCVQQHDEEVAHVPEIDVRSLLVAPVNDELSSHQGLGQQLVRYDVEPQAGRPTAHRGEADVDRREVGSVKGTHDRLALCLASGILPKTVERIVLGDVRGYVDAVDREGRRIDEESCAGLPAAFQQRPIRIEVDRPGRRGIKIPGRVVGDRSKMEGGIDPANGSIHDVHVPDIAFHDLQARVAEQVFDPDQAVGEVVEDDDVTSRAEQGLRENRPQETGPAGDQYPTLSVAWVYGHLILLLRDAWPRNRDATDALVGMAAAVTDPHGHPHRAPTAYGDKVGSNRRKPVLVRWARRPVTVVAASAAFGLALLIAGHAGLEGPTVVDDQLDARVRDVTDPFRAELRHLVRLLGPRTVVVTAAGLGLLCLALRRPRLAAVALGGPVLAGICTTALQPVVGRTLEGGFALPSGHTSGVTAVATAGLLVAMNLAGERARAVAYIGTPMVIAVSATMGVALVANRLHYASDVAAGFCTAIAVVLGTAIVADVWVSARDPLSARRYPAPGSR